MHTQPEKLNPFLIIKNYWFILILIAGLIATWTQFKSTQASTLTRLDKVEEKQVKQDETSVTILTKLSAIETSLIYLRESVDGKNKKTLTSE